MGVYRKVPREDCYKAIGKSPVGASGVYFMNTYTHKKYTQTDWATTQTHGQEPEGFARPGRSA